MSDNCKKHCLHYSVVLSTLLRQFLFYIVMEQKEG